MCNILTGHLCQVEGEVTTVVFGTRAISTVICTGGKSAEITIYERFRQKNGTFVHFPLREEAFEHAYSAFQALFEYGQPHEARTYVGDFDALEQVQDATIEWLRQQAQPQSIVDD